MIGLGSDKNIKWQLLDLHSGIFKPNIGISSFPLSPDQRWLASEEKVIGNKLRFILHFPSNDLASPRSSEQSKLNLVNTVNHSPLSAWIQLSPE